MTDWWRTQTEYAEGRQYVNDLEVELALTKAALSYWFEIASQRCECKEK